MRSNHILSPWFVLIQRIGERSRVTPQGGELFSALLFPSEFLHQAGILKIHTMKILLHSILTSLASLACLSCTSLVQTNDNFRPRYKYNTPAMYDSYGRFGGYDNPGGGWNVRQSGGSTTIGYVI